jgi:hypothetical protein
LQIKKTLDFLQATFQLSDAYRGNIMGLLGNFNGDASDDYVTRSGNRLSINSTEEELFYNFGFTWRVTENETLFYYPNGTSLSNYCNTSFVPVFTDEFRDPAKLLTLFSNDANLVTAASTVSKKYCTQNTPLLN